MKVTSVLLPPGCDEGVDRGEARPLATGSVEHGRLPVERTPTSLNTDTQVTQLLFHPEEQLCVCVS